MGVRKKHISLVIIGMILVLLSADLFAQNRGSNNNAAYMNRQQRNSSDMGNLPTYGNVPGVVDNNAPKEDADTVTKPPKVRKPLESYFFDDSTRVRPNFVWTANLERNDIKFIQIDTSLNQFQVDYPYQREELGDAYLGNLGGASIPLNYFRRPDFQDFSFAQSLATYLFTPANVRYFNVKKPFTHLSYFSSGQARKLEENFWATHAQNISPATGFNIDYRSRGTKGFYALQNSREKNLSLGFSHTGKKYTIHAGYIYNMTNVRENGGLVRDKDITDTVFELPENIDVRLRDARNLYKNNTFYVVQSYGVPMRKLTEDDFSIAERSTIFFGHSIEYSRFFRRYTDTKENSGDYYKDWYINPVESRDSTFESLLSNRVFIQLQPWDREGILGVIDAGIGTDMHKYYQFVLSDYLTKSKNVTQTSTYAYGAARGKFKKYVSWDANAKFHPFGYRSGDFSIGANASFSLFIKDKPVTLSGSILQELRSPSYWTDNYFSNHYVWNNSFAKENETRFSITFAAPHYGIEVTAQQSIVTDKIYYNAQCLPTQNGGSVSVSGLYASKEFRFGGFRLNNRVLLQTSSSQEVVPVPLVSLYMTYLYEFNIVKGVLRMQIGLDGRYNSKYYAFGYNPAIAQFYNQREKMLGAYPMVDFFVNAKWKRMRILAKLQHANEDLFSERNYFTVLHYPLNARMLKLGFSWTFYD